MDDDDAIRNDVSSLNSLLQTLEIPLVLDSPLDLTPTLLIAILESMLEQRLALSPEIRAAQTLSAKVEAMKVFLGVLSDDVVRIDVGLAEVDPRRLASGEWEETLFICRLLVWLATDSGILSNSGFQSSTSASREIEFDVTPPDDSLEAVIHARPAASTKRVPARQLDISFEPENASPQVTRSFRAKTPHLSTGSASRSTLQDSTVTTTTSACGCLDHTTTSGGGISTTCTCISSVTLLDARDASDSDISDPGPAQIPPLTRTPSLNPLPDPNDLFSPALPVRQPVRRSGWIKPVEGDVEAFERHRSPNTSVRTPSQTPHARKIGAHLSPNNTPNNIRPQVTRLTSPTQHALALLHERARLLEELAKLNLGSPSESPNRATMTNDTFPVASPSSTLPRERERSIRR